MKGMQSFSIPIVWFLNHLNFFFFLNRDYSRMRVRNPWRGDLQCAQLTATYMDVNALSFSPSAAIAVFLLTSYDVFLLEFKSPCLLDIVQCVLDHLWVSQKLFNPHSSYPDFLHQLGTLSLVFWTM